VSDPSRVEELRAQARYDRERVDLYRARGYSLRPVDPTRLRELERVAAASAERLAYALASRPPGEPPTA
jgi:hypothetical protein